MSQRISSFGQSRDFLLQLQERYAQLSRSQEQITTGQRLNSLSDDPSGAGQVIGFDAQLADIEQYQRNISDALGWTNTAEGELTGVTQALTRIRDLVLSAANGVNDQAARNSIALEVGQLKESILGHANAKYGDSYLFAGTITDAPPYVTNSYTGNASAINRRVSAGQQMQINVAGDAVFGPNGGATPATMNVFDLIDRIVTDMTSVLPSDTDELRTGILAPLDALLNGVLQQRATLGSEAARLETTQGRLDDLKGRISEVRSSIMDVDAAQAYSDFQLQNTAYQSALAAGARLMNVSLLDFLR